MLDLLSDTVAERLPLADADLTLWRRIDLHCNHAELLRELIDRGDWRQERITVYGKPYLQPRLSAWYGDIGYRYSGISLQPCRWTPLLATIREQVEAITGQVYNSLLLNYYRDQHDSMGMHSDDERDLGARPAIASLSLGEERTFVLRHRHRKDLPTTRLALGDGSLLLMAGDTQRYWRHGIAKQKKPCGPRINLTFRQVLKAA